MCPWANGFSSGREASYLAPSVEIHMSFQFFSAYEMMMTSREARAEIVVKASQELRRGHKSITRRTEILGS